MKSDTGGGKSGAGVGPKRFWRRAPGRRDADSAWLVGHTNFMGREWSRLAGWLTLSRLPARSIKQKFNFLSPLGSRLAVGLAAAAAAGLSSENPICDWLAPDSTWLPAARGAPRGGPRAATLGLLGSSRRPPDGPRALSRGRGQPTRSTD